MNNKEYKNYGVYDGCFIANKQAGEDVVKLRAGSYKVNYNGQFDILKFTPMDLNSDSILELPSGELSKIVSEMNNFLLPKTKDKYNKMGFLYKRSIFLHGKPGCGKTIITNRVAKEAIKKGAIVLFTADPNALNVAFTALNDIEPETLVVVIMEEFDSAIKSYGQEPFLLLLDSQIQKPNVIYLATTNFFDKIPSRMLRPGRFSSIVEVKEPNALARQMFLETKLGKDYADMNLWVKHTEGLTIDELKEMVQAVEILNLDFKETLERIKAIPRDVSLADHDDDDSDDDENIFGIRPSMLRGLLK